MTKKIVVTGVGAASPLGGTAAESWRALLAGESGASTLEHEWVERTQLPVTFAAQAKVAASDVLERHEVKRLDPYGFYGTDADNLLHLDTEVSGYPPYFPPTSEQRSPGVLRAAVQASPRSPAAWLALAAGLERTDRLAALRAARRAAGLDPTGVSEQVAVAVLGFSKDRPAASVGTLGTLASRTQTQQNPEVRFHLGLLFFWIKESQDAAGEFRQVREDAPGTAYAKIAHVFESCIDSPAACTALEQKGE